MLDTTRDTPIDTLKLTGCNSTCGHDTPFYIVWCHCYDLIVLISLNIRGIKELATGYVKTFNFR
jgi:hypothetical protein